jgi:molecular chaperone HscB
LCKLNGVPVEAGDRQAVPASFLMQQMEWREALEVASDEAAVKALADAVETRRRSMLDELAVLIDERADWRAAARQVQALMFVVRFAEDIDRRLEALGQ